MASTASALASSGSSAVVEARRLRHSGDFAGAIALVDGCAEFDVLLAAEKLWSLIQRGNDGAALSAARAYLALPALEDAERDLLQLFEAYLVFVVDGAILDALASAAEIWPRRYRTLELDAHVHFWLVCMYHRIQLLGAAYRERDGDVARANAVSDLTELVERLLDEHELLDATLLLATALSPIEAVQRLRSFVASCSDSGARGLALLRLATRMLDAGEPVKLVDDVLEQVASCDHRFARLEATAVRLARMTPDLNEAMRGLRELHASGRTRDNPRLHIDLLLKVKDVAAKLSDFDVLFLVLDEAKTLASSESSELLLLHFHFDLIMYANAQSGHFGKIVEACEAQLRFLMDPRRQLRAMRALYLQALGLVYTYHGDRDKALLYSRAARDAFVELRWKEQIARQSGFVGQALIVIDGFPPHEKADAYEVAQTELLEWIDDDIAEGFVEDAVEKYVSLILLEAHCTDIHRAATAGANAARWLARAEELCVASPPADIQRFSASLSQVRALVHILNGNVSAIQASGLASAVQFYSNSADWTSQFYVATSQVAIALGHIGQFQLTGSTLLLDEAEPLLEQAVETWTRFGHLNPLKSGEFLLGALWEHRYNHGHPDAFSRAMLHYGNALKACDAVRRDIAVLPAATAVHSLKYSNVPRVSETVTRAAFSLCCRHGATVLAWQWVQLSKARGLSELLGLNAAIPVRLLAPLDADDSALLDQELDLLREIRDTPEGGRQVLRHRMQLLLRQMEERPRLWPIIALRTGFPPPKDELINLLPPRTVYIDYVVERTGRISIFAFSSRSTDGDISVHGPVRLEITLSQVTAWKATHLNSTDLEYNKRVFKQLAPLVQPIWDCCQPEDTVVLCPSGVLHGVPLHAIPVGKTILLERNPVVYASSLTVLHLCLTRSSSAQQARFAAFGVPADRPYALSTATAVSTLFGVDAKLASDATLESFEGALSRGGLVYFHGHAEFNASDPMASCIRLADGPLTARAVLRGRIAPCDIALIACSSGEQDIASGDEPVGLIPALLIAGATSVLATLWPIRDQDGGTFIKEFYSSFHPPVSGELVDMAHALRSAVLQIRSRRETAAPFFWAAFVLHGAWTRPAVM